LGDVWAAWSEKGLDSLPLAGIFPRHWCALCVSLGRGEKAVIFPLTVLARAQAADPCGEATAAWPDFNGLTIQSRSSAGLHRVGLMLALSKTATPSRLERSTTGVAIK
jgi:hypothetical protein